MHNVACGCSSPKLGQAEERGHPALADQAWQGRAKAPLAFPAGRWALAGCLRRRKSLGAGKPHVWRASTPCTAAR
eukprot:1367243-Amorphochlora_amoeboformis.AAC.2